MACGCGERSILMCSMPSDRHVEGIARRTAHHLRSGGRRQAAAERGAGRGILDVGLVMERVLDGAVAGAAADIAFQRCAEILPLRLVQRRAGQDHAGGAEPALKRLRVEKRLLHRVHAALGSEAFDGGDGMALGAKRRDQAGVHRLAVEQHRAGAAVAGIAAFLDAEMAELAQKCPQALSGARRLRKFLAVDLIAHGRTPCKFGANFFGQAQRHVLAPGRLAMDVGVIERLGNALQDRVAQVRLRREFRETRIESAGWSIPLPSVRRRPQ